MDRLAVGRRAPRLLASARAGGRTGLPSGSDGPSPGPNPMCILLGEPRVPDGIVAGVDGGQAIQPPDPFPLNRP